MSDGTPQTVRDTSDEQDARRVDAVLASVLANRMESICRDMANTLLRTARSSVLALAHDFSCSIITAGNDLLASADGLPVHVIGASDAAAVMTTLHPELAEGDAFLHNDQYLANPHAGDHTILVPVFIEGKHLFTTVVRGHQADVGNALPTTYMPSARDVYEEGALIFPCVQVQRGNRDIDDIIRMCFARIRAPDIWYGDYLAMLGAARVGEESLKRVAAKYGEPAVREFSSFWLDYSERRMSRAIRELRSGTFERTTIHDPVAGLDEIPLKVRVAVDADEGRIDIDLRENPDCVPAGLNTTEGTAKAAALIGALSCLDPSVPKNSGSLRRLTVQLRENCVAGIPKFPASCSVSTTNVADRIVNITQAALSGLGDGHGLAEGPVGLGPDRPNVAGQDARAGGRPFAVQLFIGTQGGPASPTCDGWLTFVLPVAAGVLRKNSVEATEHKVPIVIRENRVRTDGEGPGKFCGAPGNVLEYGPLHDRMEIYFVNDGIKHPPRGVLGGGEAEGLGLTRITQDGERVDERAAPGFIALEPGEWLVPESCGGAGYGNPAERDPEAVLHDVVERYVTVERARRVYSVVIEGDAESPDSLRVNLDETSALRRQA